MRNLRLALALAAITSWVHPVIVRAAPPAPLPRAALNSPPVEIWRADGAQDTRHGPADFSSTFSPDGQRIAVVYPSHLIRVLDAANGKLLEELQPAAQQRMSYSLAIANTGRVAVGRPGSMEVYDVAAGAPIAMFPCLDSACTPVAMAFSPDDTLLALHEIRPIPAAPDTMGTLLVVDLIFGKTTQMNASTGLAKTAFASPRDGFGRSVARPLLTDDRELAFRLWQTRDQELPRGMLGRNWSVGAIPADSRDQPMAVVAVYGGGSTLVMRDFDGDRLLWAAPLIRPDFAPAGSNAQLSRLDQIQIAPDGRFLIGYESPISDDLDAAVAGAIVMRRTIDGAIVAVYDVPGVCDLAISPDSGRFAYTARLPNVRTVMLEVPAM